MRETLDRLTVEYQDGNGLATSKNQEGRDNPQERYPKINLNYDQLQVVIGTALGDGCLMMQNGKAKLTMCHAAKQEEYLRYKMSVLSPLFIKSEPIRYEKDKYFQFHAHSSQMCPEVLEIRNLMYKGGKKKITMRLLKKLSPTALLFWHLDDGSVIKSSANSFIWCTDSFSIGEVQTIKKWLWKTYGIESFLLESKGGYTNKTYWRLRFRKKDSVKLNEIMRKSPYYALVPESMKYKLPY